MDDQPSFAAVYRAASASAGGCAIEAGLVLKLADNECKHGRLAGDSTPACGCWSQGMAGVTFLDAVRQLAPTTIGRRPAHAERVLARRSRVVELYEAGMPIPVIAAQVGSTQGAVKADVQRLRSVGLVGRRNAERVAA